MLEKLKKHPLSVMTTLAAIALVVQYTFPEFQQLSWWAGKVSDLLTGIATALAGKNLIAGKKS